MLDVYVRGAVTRRSPGASSPIVDVAAVERRLGGAANVAHNLAKLGARVHLFGVCGRDRSADALRGALAHAGIGFTLALDERPTTTKTRVLDGARQLLRIDDESVDPISPSARDELHRAMDQHRAPDVVIVSDYDKGVVQPETLHHVLSLRPRPLLVVDPKRSSLTRFRGFDFATPNHLEATRAAGCTVPTLFKPVSLERLLRQFEGPLLITRGAEGMALVESHESVVFQPHVARAVVDVTGAGDSAIAAFALALVSGRAPVEAMRLANVCAGVAVTYAGTYAVSRAELLSAWATRDARVGARL